MGMKRQDEKMYIKKGREDTYKRTAYRRTENNGDFVI
jgi:hypothetical protein